MQAQQAQQARRANRAGHPPPHIRLVAVDLRGVDVAVPQTQRGQHSLVALPARRAAVHPQPRGRQQVP